MINNNIELDPRFSLNLVIFWPCFFIIKLFSLSLFTEILIELVRSTLYLLSFIMAINRGSPEILNPVWGRLFWTLPRVLHLFLLVHPV